MAALSQVVDVLETLYPLRYAEQWDEPGLIVGDLRQPVRNIAFAADPSMAVVDRAQAQSCRMRAVGGAYECRCSISWCRHGCG